MGLWYTVNMVTKLNMGHSAVLAVASLKDGCWYTLPRSQALAQLPLGCGTVTITQLPVACSAVSVLQATRSWARAWERVALPTGSVFQKQGTV